MGNHRTTILMFAVASFLIAATFASAQDGAKPPAPAKAAPATFESVQVVADELPKDVKIAPGTAFVSIQLETFARDPSMSGLMPKPKRTATQTFARDGGGKGSVYVIEYEGSAVPDAVLEFFPTYLWGQNHRSKEHPEEFVTQGPLLVVTSFPWGDATDEWLKARLRKRFGIRILAQHADLMPFMRDVQKAYGANDADGGLKLLADHEKDIAGYSFAQYFRGEFGVMKGDWATAERGYRRALELETSLEDPLPGQTAWAAMDGLGTALLGLKRNDEAVRALRLCIEKAPVAKVGAKDLGRTKYNFACALARVSQFDESLKALADAIAADERRRKSAAADGDFAEAIKRPEFKKLLGL